MNKRLYIILCTVMLIFSTLGAGFAEDIIVGAKSTELKYVAEFEGGKLFKAGAVIVLELNGNYRQMGRQYGALAKGDLQAMHTTIGEVFLE